MKFVKGYLGFLSILLISKNQVNPFMQILAHLFTLELLTMSLYKIVTILLILYALAYPSGN